LRQLGRAGVVELVERTCRLARRFAEELRVIPGVEIAAVELNQVLARFRPPDGDETPAAIDAYTRQVIQRVQEDGTCWLAGSTWHGMAVMRVSVSNWSTSEGDIDRSADAILRAAAR
jgi:glutamate/tyrosine decarboxylase-like PLP-dependent enzyme